MPLKTYSPSRSSVSAIALAIIPLAIIAVIVSLSLGFYVRGKQAIEEQIRERLLNTVSVAALSIDARMVERIRGSEDEQSAAHTALVSQLKHIRTLSPNVRFVYIMRKSNDPLMLSFVADADALSSNEELDVNNSGVVEEDEMPALPGDTYPVSETSVLRDRAFLSPVVDDEVTIDQWGRLVSAYAPIVAEDGQVVAILGMDIVADEFFALTEQTFSLATVAFVAVMAILMAAYILMIMRIRQAEVWRELEEERSSLVDLAMHQLGMPLATFRWWLEILKEREGGRICRETQICSQMQAGVERLDAIIQSLHEVSHLKEELKGYSARTTSVAVVARTVTQDIKKLYRHKKQKFVLKFARGLRAISIDRKLFAGMLREIIENAAIYSPDLSTINVRVSNEGSGVRIEVVDKGCGIPQKDMPHIFEKFHRASNASRFNQAGNGLGMYIVKRIIQKARGRISIQSEVNTGTTVTVHLPSA